MATAASQVDSTQRPAVADAVGHVLINGKFQCTRMDRKGVATVSPCSAVMNNTKASIKSHLNKIHDPNSSYQAAQANNGPLRCSRPRQDGKGLCEHLSKNIHALVSHVRQKHGHRGSSASLRTPWDDLTAPERAWYMDRLILDPTNNERLKKQKFPGTEDLHRVSKRRLAKHPMRKAPVKTT
ncbi:hypothetical protein F5B17DRAFT_356616 [Nemania serpens]|nr:hypothetical protein F5B17DRAFT_356616 [Nemania serpens]